MSQDTNPIYGKPYLDDSIFHRYITAGQPFNITWGVDGTNTIETPTCSQFTISLLKMYTCDASNITNCNMDGNGFKSTTDKYLFPTNLPNTFTTINNVPTPENRTGTFIVPEHATDIGNWTLRIDLNCTTKHVPMPWNFQINEMTPTSSITISTSTFITPPTSTGSSLSSNSSISSTTTFSPTSLNDPGPVPTAQRGSYLKSSTLAILITGIVLLIISISIVSGLCIMKRRRRRVACEAISKPSELGTEPAVHELHHQAKEYALPSHTLSFPTAPVSPMSPTDGSDTAAATRTQYHELETPLDGMFPAMRKFDYGISHELPESDRHDRA